MKLCSQNIKYMRSFTKDVKLLLINCLQTGLQTKPNIFLITCTVTLINLIAFPKHRLYGRHGAGCLGDNFVNSCPIGGPKAVPAVIDSLPCVRTVAQQSVRSLFHISVDISSGKLSTSGRQGTTVCCDLEAFVFSRCVR